MKRLVIYAFLLITLLTSLLLNGCGGKEYAYVEDQELKQGPGLFSGEDGVFTIYGNSTSGKEQEEKNTE